MIRIARAGAELGQFSSHDISAGLKSGKFLYSDHFFQEGSVEWMPLSLFIPEVKKKKVVIKKIKFQPTTEQEAIVKNLPGKGELMLINAYAGSGKTETLRLMAERYPDINFTYLCYNRDTADKAKRRFPKNTKCNTIHSLAHAAVGRFYKPDYRMPTTKEVMEKFNISQPYVAVIAIEAISRFCNSTNAKIEKIHFHDKHQDSDNILRKYPYIISLSQSIWDEIIDPNSSLPISHDVYLKLWSFKSPQIAGDIILHDESQDMNPVTLQILNEQKGKLNPGLVIVGDTHQAIYAWRGAVNTMESLWPHATYKHNLTTSFRFGQSIADGASKVLQHLKGDMVRITGAGPTKSDIPDSVFIGRKNASLIDMAIVRIKSEPNLRLHFAGTRLKDDWDPYFLYELQKPLDMLNLYRGRPEKVELLQMKKLKNFEEIAALIQGDDEGDGVDQELEWYFEKLIKPYGDELPDLINEIRSRSVSPESANVSFSTAHRAKGLEWKNVVMLEDFWTPRPITPESPLSDDEKEEVNAIYVAMTRASISIDYGSVMLKWLESKTIT